MHFLLLLNWQKMAFWKLITSDIAGQYKVQFMSVGWVLWHINLCKLFNAKFCLYVYTFNQRFLNEYLGKIFYKQDFICLHMINQF